MFFGLFIDAHQTESGQHLFQIFTASILVVLILLPNFLFFGKPRTNPAGKGYVSGSYTRRKRAEAAAAAAGKKINKKEEEAAVTFAIERKNE